jgi:hypothetical protein
MDTRGISLGCVVPLTIQIIQQESLLRSHDEGGLTMGNLSSLIGQMKKEKDRVERQLTGLTAALKAFAGLYGEGTTNGRRISSAGKKRIAAAQKARWAKVRGESVVKPRTMSDASRRKIAAAQRARWAKFRKANA